MMNYCGIRFFIAAIILFSSFAQNSQAADTPTSQVQQTVDRVLTIVKDQSGISRENRRNQLRETIYPRFQFNEMARRSLGSHWKGLTPETQQEFVNTFVDLLQDVYLDKIESYQSQKIAYLGEVLEGQYALVKSRLTDNKGTRISLDYKLIRTNGEWKVYDVVIENVSLVNNYRSQFDRILTSTSFDELLRRMKEKNLAIKAKTQK